MRIVSCICTLFSGHTSEVLNSERVSQLLNVIDESAFKLIADTASKFYKLGFEDGFQAAFLSGVKTVSFTLHNN